MQWLQVRRDASGRPRVIELCAEKTKTNETRMIPVGQRLAAVLEMRLTGPDGETHKPTAFVFGDACGYRILSVKTARRATCERAGIVGLHFHDLRREFGSRLMESGADLHDVRAFLGHSNIAMTSRYLRSTTDRLARALAKLEAFEVPPAGDDVAGRTEVAQIDSTGAPDTSSDTSMNGPKPLNASELRDGGPPEDRTRDQPLKRRMLYH